MMDVKLNKEARKGAEAISSLTGEDVSDVVNGLVARGLSDYRQSIPKLNGESVRPMGEYLSTPAPAKNPAVYLTAREAAKVMGVSYTTLMNRAKEGKIKAKKVKGRGPSGYQFLFLRSRIEKAASS